MSQPVAGPSRLRDFPPESFLQHLSRRSTATPAPPSSSSRSNTPFITRSSSVVGLHRSSSSRARSASTFSHVSSVQYRKEAMDKQRQEVFARHQTRWEQLLEKYSNIDPAADDEVDIMTGEITKNRGRLESMVGRDLGEASEEDEEDDEETVEFDEDEDELGAWDERSGLDSQAPEEDDFQQRQTVDVPWDLEAFMRAESIRRAEATAMGFDESDGEASEADARTDRSYELTGLFKRTAELDLADQAGSDDELLAETSDAEEATRFKVVKRALTVQPATQVPSTSQTSTAEKEPFRAKTALPAQDPVGKLLASRPSSEKAIAQRVTLPEPVSTARRSQVEAQSALPLQPPRPLVHSQSFRIPSPPSVPSGNRPDNGPPPRVEPATATLSAVSQQPTSAPKPPRPIKRLPIKRTPAPVPTPTLRDLFSPEPTVAPVDAPSSQVARSITPPLPTLHDLFSPEPENAVPSPSLDLPAAVRSPSPDFAIFDSAPLRTPLRGITPSVKGSRQRQRSSTPRQPRTCRACQIAGGERAEKAAICRGRQFRHCCPWHPNASKEKRTATPSMTPEMAPAPALDPRDDRYLADTEATTGGKRLRKCGYCRKSSDEARREKAAWCKGRIDKLQCSLRADDEDERHRLATEEASLVVPMTPQPETPPPHAPGGGLTPPQDERWRYFGKLSLQKGTMAVRECRHCREADGYRQENASWCKGRTWSRYCTWDGDEEFKTPRGRSLSKRAMSRARSEASMRDAETPAVEISSKPRSVDIERGPRRTGRTRRTVSSSATPSPSRIPLPHSPAADRMTVTDPSIRHVSSSQEESGLNSPTARPWTRLASRKQSAVPSVAREDSLPPVFAGLEDLFGEHRSESDLQPTAVAHTQTTLPSESDASSRLSTMSSLPPSSPPLPYESWTSHAPSSARISRLLPTHSYSDSVQASSPGPPRAVSRHVEYTYRPTPPSSSVLRSSPMISEYQTPSSSLPRKGILRRPSSLARSSTPQSAKRTRFSLLPSSPPRRATSDAEGTDVDNGQDGHYTSVQSVSPYTARDTASPETQHPSSSPFTKEIRVRAADIGCNLPQYTGRLPKTMLADYAPAFTATSQPTLGSALRQAYSSSPVGNKFALPTPPRSFGSTGSKESGSTPRPTSPSTAALMLPPPVPPKAARPLTPATSEEREVAPRPKSTSKVQIPMRQRLTPARSRSRSASTVPAKWKERAHASTPNSVHSHTRIERTLARVARQLDDGAGLEWGMDEDVGDEHTMLWREGSVVHSTA